MFRGVVPSPVSFCQERDTCSLNAGGRGEKQAAHRTPPVSRGTEFLHQHVRHRKSTSDQPQATGPAL